MHIIIISIALQDISCTPKFSTPKEIYCNTPGDVIYSNTPVELIYFNTPGYLIYSNYWNPIPLEI